MRSPDATNELAWRGHAVTVRTWYEPTEFHWSEFTDEDPGVEGLDILVEVTLGEWKGRASLGSCYGNRSYIEDTQREVIDEALSDLEFTLTSCAVGAKVKTAKLQQSAARRLLGASK